MVYPEQALAGIIEECQPKALVAFGDKAHMLAKSWAQVHDETQLTCLDAADVQSGFSLTHIQDLALVTDSLEHLDRAQGQTLLGQLRNYGTRQIGVLVPESSGWGMNDFIGLGFRRQAQFDNEGKSLSLYTYNINNYNHKRSWNNPDNWANPEMWGKAWW